MGCSGFSMGSLGSGGVLGGLWVLWGSPCNPPRAPQACELHVAGFRFAVLDGAFVAHRGFKEPGGFHGAREAELGRNRGLFRAFRRELRLRYPESPRRC